MENALSIKTDYPGTELSKALGNIALFTNHNWKRECGEHDLEVYTRLTNKMLELVGGIWYIEDRVDEDYAYIVEYHHIAALFHGGHYSEAGQ